jgi:hypothetical protein
MMSGREKFQSDLTTLIERLTYNTTPTVENRLIHLKDWLIELQKQNIVKINHSAMELVCAKYLLEKEYDITIEYPLSNLLTCDLYGTKGLGNLIVEIETGFIPPENALCPLTYTSARLASKIIRYSSFAGKFALGVPPHYILPFPRALAKLPRNRTEAEIQQIKALCDAFYQKPPVTEEEICNARIHEIYIVDVDRGKVQEIDPQTYQKRAIQKGVVFDCLTAEP